MNQNKWQLYLDKSSEWLRSYFYQESKLTDSPNALKSDLTGYSFFTKNNTYEETPYSTENRTSFFKLFTLRNITNIDGGCDDVFDENYASFGFTMAPDIKLNTPLPLIDLRGYRFMGNKYGMIGGIGLRFPLQKEDDCQLVGLNTTYQYRSTENGNFHQASIGIEYLTKFIEFRVSGYIPLGNTELCSTCVFDDYEGDYEVRYNFTEKVSYAMSAEIGLYLLNADPFSIYLAAGPYQIYAIDNQNIETGLEVLLKERYRDILSAEIKYRYDSLFKSQFEVEFAIHLPLYQLGRQKKSCSIPTYQIYQPLRFIDAIPVGKKSCWETNY